MQFDFEFTPYIAVYLSTKPGVYVPVFGRLPLEANLQQDRVDARGNHYKKVFLKYKLSDRICSNLDDLISRELMNNKLFLRYLSRKVFSTADIVLVIEIDRVDFVQLLVSQKSAQILAKRGLSLNVENRSQS